MIDDHRARSTDHAESTTSSLLAVSGMEHYELSDYRAGFERDNPGVSVTIDRRSTRELHGHLLDLGRTDQWDVVLGWSLTSLVDHRILELLAPIPSSILGVVDADHKDADGLWISGSAFAPAFCVDGPAVDANDVPLPSSWHDLGDPVFEGRICLPNPNISGAGFLHLAGLVQLVGFDEAALVLERVAANRPTIVKSAFEPCQAVLDGAATVGATVTTATERLRRDGRAILSSVPSDSSCFELEAMAMNRHAQNQKVAAALLSWMIGDEAESISLGYAKLVPSKINDSLGADLVALDATWAANSRDELCRLWDEYFPVAQI